MPNRYPLRSRAAVSIVDRPPSRAERMFAAVAISSMTLVSAILILF